MPGGLVYRRCKPQSYVVLFHYGPDVVVSRRLPQRRVPTAVLATSTIRTVPSVALGALRDGMIHSGS